MPFIPHITNMYCLFPIYPLYYGYRIYINLIRLKTLLTEITLGTPYQTQFVWQDMQWGLTTEFTTPAGTYEVLAVESSDPDAHAEWSIGFSTVMPSGTKSVSQTSAALSREDPSTKETARITGAEYMRVLSTVAEAIFDFIAQYGPSTIHFEPYDNNETKTRQKDAIYGALLRSAHVRLLTLGYRTMRTQAGEYVISRSTRADSTGIMD